MREWELAKIRLWTSSSVEVPAGAPLEVSSLSVRNAVLHDLTDDEDAIY